MADLSDSARGRLRGLYDLHVVRAGANSPGFVELVNLRFAERRLLAGAPWNPDQKCDFVLTEHGHTAAWLIFDRPDL